MNRVGRPASTPPPWSITLARILTGWIFIQYGWFSKLQDPKFAPGMKATLTRMAEHSAFGFYRAFLSAWAVPHATVFAYLTGWGETLLGVALVLGAFSNPASLLGIFMTLNFYLASRSWDALLFAAWCFAFLHVSAGSRWGLDPILARVLPARVVYFPRR